ncbi:unnamed protein product, partial [Choristocarpus tenellus]
MAPLLNVLTPVGSAIAVAALSMSNGSIHGFVVAVFVLVLLFVWGAGRALMPGIMATIARSIVQVTRCVDMDEVQVELEWINGYLFLVLHDPIATEWIINLVNRYMHGPIPMKVESCRADVVKMCLSPSRLWQIGSLETEATGIRTFGRRTHEDEWDEGLYYRKAVRFRRWHADYITSLV